MLIIKILRLYKIILCLSKHIKCDISSFSVVIRRIANCVIDDPSCDKYPTLAEPDRYFPMLKMAVWLRETTGLGGKSVRQADVSGGTHFPRKLCPTGQDILFVASRIICPPGKCVRA